MIIYQKMFDLLAKNGYTPSRIKKEGILSQSTIARIKKGEGGLAHENINKLCLLLNCKPDDLMEFVYTDAEKQELLQNIENFLNRNTN